MANPEQVGSFVATTNVWDPSEIQAVDVNSPRFKELLVLLYQNINLMAVVLNTKDTGYYNDSEFVNGQVYFPDPTLDSSTQLNPTFRQVYRKVIDFGQLPNATLKSVPHGITVTTATTFTRLYGAASDTTGFNYIPIVYADPSGAVASLYADATNVNISTNLDFSNYNVCYVVLEYLQF